VFLNITHRPVFFKIVVRSVAFTAAKVDRIFSGYQLSQLVGDRDSP
jgi:hypothetical protein